MNVAADIPWITDATRVALALEDGTRVWEGTLAEFFAENPDEDRDDIIADLDGGNCFLGGGAAPIFQLLIDTRDTDTWLTLYLARLAIRDLDPADESSMRAHVMAYCDADAAGVIFA